MPNSQDEIQNTSILNEITASDQFGGQWDEFVKKYRKFKKDPDVYVNFTNFATGNDLQKNPSPNPNHTDPIGVYGYPLEYVLSYPGDIWYGANYRYLRVIRNKFPGKTLFLNHMQEYQARKLLDKCLEGEEEAQYAYGRAESYIEAYNKRLKVNINTEWFTRKLPGVCFFYGIQHDTSSKGRKNDKYNQVPGTTQSARLKKSGYYAIQDNAKKDREAIINEREPEQIIFLYPQAFNIEETFTLSKKNLDSQEGVGSTTNTIAGDAQVRKLAAYIASSLGEKLVPDQKGELRTDGAYPSLINKGWYTAEQTHIEILEKDSSLNWRMNNTKPGQKLHRSNKENPHYYSVTLSGPKGNLTRTVGSNNSLKDDILSLTQEYNSLVDQESTPHTPSGDREAYKKQQDEYYAGERAKKNAESLRRFPAMYQDLTRLLSVLGIPMVLEVSTDEDKIALYNAIRSMENVLNTATHTSSTSYPTPENNPEDWEKVKKGFSDAYKYFSEGDILDKPEPVVAKIVSKLWKVIEARGKYNHDMVRNISWISEWLEKGKGMTESTRLTEAVQYSYYEKHISKDIFDNILKKDPTREKYFGRWLVETTIRTIVSPLKTSYVKTAVSGFTDFGADNSNGGITEAATSIWNNVMWGTKDGRTSPCFSLANLVGEMKVGRELRILEEFQVYQKINEDDFNTFLTIKNQLPPDKKNIMDYKDFQSFYRFINSDEADEILRKVEFSKVGKDEYAVWYKDENWFIIKPLTEKAAVKYGWGTKWCTAGRQDNMFRYYTNGDLVIFINKDNKKWQIYINGNSEEWKDAANNDINHEELLSILPDGARTAIFKKAKYFEFLPVNTREEVTRTVLNGEHKDKIKQRLLGKSKFREFDDSGVSGNRLYRLFPGDIGKYALENVFYEKVESNYDSGGVAYSEGYDSPWEYLDEEPELASEASDCETCGGSGVGLYIWDGSEYSPNLSKEEYDRIYDKIKYGSAGGESKAQEFSSLYREMNGKYYLADKEKAQKFFSDPITRSICRVCEGSGKEEGKHWKRNSELWSEDQKERAGQDAESQSVDFALGEWVRDSDRGWKDSGYMEDILDHVVKVIFEPNSNVHEDNRVKALLVFLNFCPQWDINIPIAEDVINSL